MRQNIGIIAILLPAFCFGQTQKIAGTYCTGLPAVRVTFNPDSTFNYVTSAQHPTFSRWEAFSEKGKWTRSGDTIILNPMLPKKLFVESDIEEETVAKPGTTAYLQPY